MKLEDVFKLVDAGFTKDEILAMDSQEEKPAEVVEEPVVEKEEERKELTIKEQLDANMKALASAMDDFTARVKEANVLTAKISDEQLRKETPEELIAKIINPQTKKGV